jgi:hypothetical protein
MNMDIELQKAKTLYSLIKRGKISPSEAIDIYHSAKHEMHVGYTFFSLSLRMTRGDEAYDLNWEAVVRRKPKGILHLSRVPCTHVFFKRYNVLCFQHGTVVEHKVGKCPRDVIP